MYIITCEICLKTKAKKLHVSCHRHYQHELLYITLILYKCSLRRTSRTRMIGIYSMNTCRFTVLRLHDCILQRIFPPTSWCLSQLAVMFARFFSSSTAFCRTVCNLLVSSVFSPDKKNLSIGLLY